MHRSDVFIDQFVLLQFELLDNFVTSFLFYFEDCIQALVGRFETCKLGFGSLEGRLAAYEFFGELLVLLLEELNEIQTVFDLG